MKVSQLRDMLEGQDDDAEVRVAIQPSYPLRLSVKSVFEGRDVLDYDETDDDEVKDAGIVWIVTTESAPYGESPYAPRDLWQ